MSELFDFLEGSDKKEKTQTDLDLEMRGSISMYSALIIEKLREREYNGDNTYFVRHGQTDRNKKGIMNPGDVDSDLNEVGINQAIEAGEDFVNRGLDIDIVYSSDLKRAIDTGMYIGEQVEESSGKKIQYVQESGLKEMLAGRFKDSTHDELISEFDIESTSELRKAYKDKTNNGVESIEEFDLRVTKAIYDALLLNDDKNMLFVGHSGTSRVFKRIIESLSLEEAHYFASTMKNSIIHVLLLTKGEVISILEQKRRLEKESA